MTETQTPKSLNEVLDAFMTESERPADHLHRYVSDFPEYAEELTDLASEMMLLEVVPVPDTPAAETDPADQASINKAMNVMHARLRELPQPEVKPLENPFEGRTPAQLKEIAAAVNLDITLMAKLKNRLINATTIPQQLVGQLAQRLQTVEQTLNQWFQQPPILQAAHFKSGDKPDASRKEDFAEAVKRSQLDDSKKDQWLD